MLFDPKCFIGMPVYGFLKHKRKRSKYPAYFIYGWFIYHFIFLRCFRSI